MDALAVVLNAPLDLTLRALPLDPAGADDVVVDIDFSGVSAGTERLLWSGAMPPFPGMGYPLVPGYESVGRINGGARDGERVFVPGARCFGPVHGLFGATASRVIVPGSRALPLDGIAADRGILLALAATAQHALSGFVLPELIVGHGVLGRLLARLTVLAGGSPTVWERNPVRAEGATGYTVLDPDADKRRDYRAIYDASGDAALLDALIMRLAPGGEIVLAGFYSDRPSFAFPPAFMREARFRIAAQWQSADLIAVRDLAAAGSLDLAGLITHHAPAETAPEAYRTAFENPDCLKMVLDWKASA